MQFRFLIIFVLLVLGIGEIFATNISKSKTTTIDTLILYTPEVASRYNGEQNTRIEHIVTTANTILNNSQIDVKLNIVKIQEYKDIDSNSSARDIIQKVRTDLNITNLRNSIGADEVIIFGTYSSKEKMCGLGYVNRDNPDYAYAYVSINCASYHLAHELGHNLGLYHSEKSYPYAGYARGYGVDNEFETIMAYESEYNGEKIYKFSSPLLDCNDMPCGVEIGYEHEADARNAIIQNAPTISLFKISMDNNSSYDLDELKKVYEFYKNKYIEAKERLEEIGSSYQEAESNYQIYLSNNESKIDENQKYLLKANRDKLYLSYRVYENDVYLVIKREYEFAKQIYNKLIGE